MRTHAAIELALTLAIVATITACDREAIAPRYDGKTYGQQPGTGDAAAKADGADTEIELPDGDDSHGDAVPADGNGDAQGEGDAGGVQDGEDGGADAADAGDAGDVTGDDGDGGDDVERIPPEKLIKSADYRAVFDKNATRGIRNGSGYRSLGLILSNRIKDNLVTKPEDGLVLAQTYGDGAVRSTVLQDLRNSAGDASRTDPPSVSGTLAIGRISGSGCPAPFVCAERMLFSPKVGDPSTICFFDAATGARKPFPYAAAPNYAQDAFAKAYGTYGPFRVARYAGTAVDCASPTGVPVVEETLQVTVAEAKADGVTLGLRKTDPVTPQFGVAFRIERTQNDMTAPYADETVFLHHVTTYYLNAERAELVKLVVASRMSVDVAAQSGGGILGGLAGLLTNIDGIEVDLHLDWCRNLLDEKDVDHCAP